MPSPQKLRWAKLRIFVVAVSAISVLSVLVYLLSGGTWLKPKAYLTTHIPDSTGLEPGADVLLNGVKIGRVATVLLAHTKNLNRVVEVRLKVEAAFLPYIPEDSVTTIDSANLLGDQYININMGRSPRAVRDGSELRYPPPSTLVLKTDDLRQFEAQLRTIDQTIQDIHDGKGPLGQFVVSDALYRQFLDGVANVEKEMRAATGSQSQLGQALYSAAVHDNLSASLRRLDDRVAELQANGMLRDSTQYDRIRDQIAQVRHTLADLNAGKGAGGELIASDAAYAEWNRRLAAFIENVDALNSGEGSLGHMLTNAQTYESLNGALRQLQSTMKEFREDPQKFLRIKIF
ncbi:MAG: MlaD family protein [Bryobacteraceae bacterium]|jgi:phospholipid/cholesterol/gamma-HCH transport system substrate-binding protein